MHEKSSADMINAFDPVLHGSLIEAIRANQIMVSRMQNEDSIDKRSDPRTFEGAFQRIVAEIKDCYIYGTVDFIEVHHPALYNRVIAARDKIDDVWKKGHKGEARIDEFITALDEWKSLHIQAIDLFKSENT